MKSLQIPPSALIKVRSSEGLTCSLILTQALGVGGYGGSTKMPKFQCQTLQQRGESEAARDSLALQCDQCGFSTDQS